MDWDKLRIFHAAASAGSFTHAGESLHMSQSAVSRQVSALETDLHVPLFHRHARGLILTEQGELLYRTAQDMFNKLAAVQSRLTDSKEKPSGNLRVTTTVGLGSTWLTARIGEFVELFPEMQLEIILSDVELDLAMRQADVAIRMRQPTQPDLIQRRLFTVHFHLYASPNYIKRFGNPQTLDDLEEHRIISFGTAASIFLQDINWLETAGRGDDNPRVPALKINNVFSIKEAVQRGIGIALLPDYLIDRESGLVQLIPDADVPSFDTYFVYPEELRNTARVTAFRDFLVSNAQRWTY